MTRRLRAAALALTISALLVVAPFVRADGDCNTYYVMIPIVTMFGPVLIQLQITVCP